MQKFLKGSTILAITTIFSYALGLFRDRVFAQTFGASRVLDAYNAAFIVPDLILNIFVAGALAAAFVPIFSEIRQQNDRDRSDGFVSSVLSGSILSVFVVGAAAYLFAPQIASLVVRGFSDADQLLYVNLMRILLLSPLLFAVSNTLGSILVSEERFFWYGISAALYNLGIIGGAIFLAPIWGIYGAAIGALIGAGLHAIARLIGLARFHLRFRPVIDFSEYYRKFLRLMLPKMIGHPIEQITFFGYTIIASTLGAGSIAILNFARNFQSAPVAVIGINMALAVFPILSRTANQRDERGFLRQIRLTSLAIGGLTIASAIAMYLLRRPLIALLLGGGEFGSDAVAATAATLGVFTLAIPTESVSHLLARGFYSLKNSVTPVIMSILGLAIAIASGWYFSKILGVPGLALGFFAGSAVKVVLLAILLRLETRKLV